MISHCPRTAEQHARDERAKDDAFKQREFRRRQLEADLSTFDVTAAAIRRQVIESARDRLSALRQRRRAMIDELRRLQMQST